MIHSPGEQALPPYEDAMETMRQITAANPEDMLDPRVLIARLRGASKAVSSIALAYGTTTEDTNTDMWTHIKDGRHKFTATAEDLLFVKAGDGHANIWESDIVSTTVFYDHVIVPNDSTLDQLAGRPQPDWHHSHVYATSVRQANQEHPEGLHINYWPFYNPSTNERFDDIGLPGSTVPYFTVLQRLSATLLDVARPPQE